MDPLEEAKQLPWGQSHTSVLRQPGERAHTAQGMSGDNVASPDRQAGAAHSPTQSRQPRCPAKRQHPHFSLSPPPRITVWSLSLSVTSRGSTHGLIDEASRVLKASAPCCELTQPGRSR